MEIIDILADPQQAAACIAESTTLRKHLRGLIEQYKETGSISAIRLFDAEEALSPHGILCYCVSCLPYPKEEDDDGNS